MQNQAEKLQCSTTNYYTATILKQNGKKQNKTMIGKVADMEVIFKNVSSPVTLRFSPQHDRHSSKFEGGGDRVLLKHKKSILGFLNDNTQRGDHETSKYS